MEEMAKLSRLVSGRRMNQEDLDVSCSLVVSEPMTDAATPWQQAGLPGATFQNKCNKQVPDEGRCERKP